MTTFPPPHPPPHITRYLQTLSARVAAAAHSPSDPSCAPASQRPPAPPAAKQLPLQLLSSRPASANTLSLLAAAARAPPAAFSTPRLLLTMPCNLSGWTKSRAAACGPPPPPTPRTPTARCVRVVPVDDANKLLLYRALHLVLRRCRRGRVPVLLSWSRSQLPIHSHVTRSHHLTHTCVSGSCTRALSSSSTKAVACWTWPAVAASCRICCTCTGYA